MSDDEITKVGLPPIPAVINDTYFAECARQMALLVLETRGYNEALRVKIEKDDLHWASIQHEISSVRSNMTDLKREVDADLRDSDSKIRAFEGRLQNLEERVNQIERASTSLAQ